MQKQKQDPAEQPFLRETKVAIFGYALGLLSWSTLYIAHENHLPRYLTQREDFFAFPYLVALFMVLAVCSLLLRLRKSSYGPSNFVIAVIGGLGALVTFTAVDATLTSPANTLLYSGLFGVPVGVAMTIPLIVITDKTRSSQRSHDDGDRLLAFAGLWMIFAPILPLIMSAAETDGQFPLRTIVESALMLAMNIGAGIFAYGLGKSLHRKRWLERARRGEIEGIRVRDLEPTERLPAVMPLVPLRVSTLPSVHVQHEVIERVEEPTGGAYRSQQLAHPIAIA